MFVVCCLLLFVTRSIGQLSLNAFNAYADFSLVRQRLAEETKVIKETEETKRQPYKANERKRNTNTLDGNNDKSRRGLHPST